MKRIGLIVDNPKRDLRGVLLVARELTKLGHAPVLVPMYGMAYEVPLLDLDAVVVNYLRLNVENVFKVWKHQGLQIFVLDTEGGLLSDSGSRSPEGWAKFIKANNLGSLIDGYFFWGEKLYQGFVEHSGISKDKLFVTGSPRHDICSDTWRTTLDYPFKGHILVNTNFAGVNPKFSKSVNKEEKNAEQAGLETALIKSLLREQNELMGKMVNTISQLGRDFPQFKFVVRPHPFENHKIYEEQFRELSNVVIDPEGEVFDVLSEAKFLLHVNCSTAVEALLLGKVPLSLDFINGSEIKRYAPLPQKISCQVSSYEQLSEIIRSANSTFDLDIQEIIQNEVVPAFGPVDGRASERVARLLDKLVVEKSGKKKWALVGDSLSVQTRNSPVRSIINALVINVLGSRLSHHFQSLFYPEKKDKALLPQKIEGLLNRLSRSDNLCTDLKARYMAHPVTHVALNSLRLERSVTK